MSSENSTKIGIIFDLDGTLLDSTGLISRIPEELAIKYEVSIDETTSDDIQKEILKTIQGRSTKFLILRLIFYVAKKYRVPWYLRIRYLKDAGALYKQFIKHVPLFPGVKDTINFLIKNGFPIAINTTSSRKEVFDRFESRMEFLDFFNDMIITRSDVKNLKPHPESIQILRAKMGIHIKKIVMVGDMDADIHAGINSGCTTVGVLSGFASKEMMKEYNPDFIIESVRELPDIIPNLLEKMDPL